MSTLLAFLSRIAAWAFAVFVQRTRAAGAAEEREKIETAHEAHQQRQDKVANRPVSDDDLQKSLKDGSF